MTRLIHAFLAFLLSPALALPYNSPIDKDPPNQRKQARKAEDRAQAVIDAFRVSWEGYYEHAFPNDELHPVTNSFSNSRYGNLSFSPC
jgi:mannosyl-oligosaccharide alpha-1,2-mannosidase